MNRPNIIFAQLLFGIQVFLLFLLLFEFKIALPAWLEVLGRMHPAILHLPIGGLFGIAAVTLFKKSFPENGYRHFVEFALKINAMAAALTALFGFFLSKESGYDTSALFLHKWWGLSANWLCWALWWMFQNQARWFPIGLWTTLFIMFVAGHLGGELTHGKGFVLQPLHRDAMAINAETASAYQLTIEPVFREKCFSCHNAQKAKGGLVLTDTLNLQKGGKNGPLWTPGDTSHSLLLQRIQLPHNEKKHMPPAGKPQLSAEEIALLQAWVLAGADLHRKLPDYPETGRFRTIANRFLQEVAMPAIKSYAFAAADSKVVADLNTPFCSVYPTSLNSPALCADFFVRQKFDAQHLQKLAALKMQLVSLNLSNMPLRDADLKPIAAFQNLEKLLLNGTDISTEGLLFLRSMPRLQSLSVSNTRVGAGIASVLGSLPALEEIFVWNTAISGSEVLDLQKKFPRLKIEQGFVADTSERLQLPAPILRNENAMLADTEKIAFKQPFPGAQILLTFDGSTPASSTSALPYSQPMSMDKYTHFKAQVVKPGWIPSEVTEHSFFKKGLRVTRAEFASPPDPQYKGEGAATLCDGKLGRPENFRDPTWIGNRDKPFAGLFFFAPETPLISAVTLSFGTNVYSYILPPTRVEVWGGKDERQLRLLKTEIPTPATAQDLGLVKSLGLRIEIPAAHYACIKVVAKPVPRLPNWHPGKGDKGWVFVDEVLFN